MNCKEAKAAIRISDAVLSKAVIDHIDSCEECHLLLLDSINEGLMTGRLESIEMPEEIRVVLATGLTPVGQTAALRRPTPTGLFRSQLPAWAIILPLILLAPLWFLAMTVGAGPVNQKLAFYESALRAERDKTKRAEENVRNLSDRERALEGTVAEDRQRLGNVVAPIDESLYKDRSGNLIVASQVRPEDKNWANAAVDQGVVEIPSLIKEWNQHPTTLGAEGPATQTVALLSPIGTVVSSTRPVFLWKERPTASTYLLTIQTDSRDAVASVLLNRVAGGKWHVEVFNSSGAVVRSYDSETGSRWSLADSNRTAPLTRGQEYRWMAEELDKPVLDANVIGKPDFAALFKVADSVTIAKLNRVRALYGGSHLLLGTYYAKQGLIEEARRELERVHSNMSAKKLLKALPPSP